MDPKPSEGAKLQPKKFMTLNFCFHVLCIGETEFEDLLDFELSPLSISLCNEMCEPRYTKAKSALQTKLKVETSLRLVNFNIVVIDGLGMFL